MSPITVALTFMIARMESYESVVIKECFFGSGFYASAAKIVSLHRYCEFT